MWLITIFKNRIIIFCFTSRDNFIFKFPVYIRVKEFKTNKEVIINTRRILYSKEIDKNSSLIMMNSGYKVKTNLSIDNL